MARNVTLTRLLDKLRGELRLSLNPAHNRQVRDSHVLQLQRQQERLWNDFAWPHLRKRRFITLVAGQRYYDPPDDMLLDRVESISVKWGGDWKPLTREIDDERLSAFDSDEGEQSWPIEAWRIDENEKIEVWPVPSTDGDVTTREGQMRVTGIRNLRPLVADSDRCDLDDELIVLSAAGVLLAAAGAKDAELKLRQANTLYSRLRGNLTPLRQYKLFARAPDRPRRPRGPPTIHYRTET